MKSENDRLHEALSALDVQAAVVDASGRILEATAAWRRADAALGESRPQPNLVDALRIRAGDRIARRTRRALAELVEITGETGAGRELPPERPGAADRASDADDEDSAASAAREPDAEIEFTADAGEPVDDELPRPERWFRLRLVAIAPAGGAGRDGVRIAAEIRDVSREKSVQATLRGRERRLKLTNLLLRELSERDPLTSLWNRRGIERALRREQRQSRRTGAPLAALLIDCDDFKRVNDRFGHTAGDRLLRRLGKILQRQLRPRDLAARIGGDEFLVLLPATDLRAAAAGAERLRIRISEELAEERDLVSETITVSLGLAPVRPETVNLEAVVASTQEALKVAKISGKNRVGGTPDTGGVRASGSEAR